MMLNRKAIAFAAVMTLAGSAFTPFATAQSAEVQSALIDGTVTKIDQAAGRITLRHGPIKKLDMDMGMTMVFRAQDPAMLKQVKVGDKVKFDADRVDGQLTLTRVQKSR